MVSQKSAPSRVGNLAPIFVVWLAASALVGAAVFLSFSEKPPPKGGVGSVQMEIPPPMPIRGKLGHGTLVLVESGLAQGTRKPRRTVKVDYPVLYPKPGDATGLRAVFAPAPGNIEEFLRRQAYPGSMVMWITGSASLGVEFYRVRTSAGRDLAARLELTGSNQLGSSHGSGPWRIVEVGPYDPQESWQSF